MTIALPVSTETTADADERFPTGWQLKARPVPVVATETRDEVEAIPAERHPTAWQPKTRP